MLIGRKSKAGSAERLTEVTGGKTHINFVRIGAHAEEHRHGFVDGQRSEPIIVEAPRCERGNGNWHGGTELVAEVEEKSTIEGALGELGIEVDLNADDARQGSGVGNGGDDGRKLRADEGLLVRSHQGRRPVESASIRRRAGFDPEDGNELGAIRDEQGLKARMDDDLTVMEIDGRSEIGDGGTGWIDEAKILGALPRPKHDWGRSLQKIAGLGVSGEAEADERR
jgi:hypothetical protein